MMCSGILLCGGRGARVGGADKGRLRYAGSTLAEVTMARLAPQVDDLVISANRNLDWYRERGHPVVEDRFPDFRGPLAGLQAALPHCRHPVALIASCDMPELPSDLAQRLLEPMANPEIDICYAWDGTRHQYLVATLRVTLLDSLERYLDSGCRSVHGWYDELRCTATDFSDQPGAFTNLNTGG